MTIELDHVIVSAREPEKSAERLAGLLGVPWAAKREFDEILERLRAADIAWRSEVGGTVDRRVNTAYGGRMVYWNEPEGHQWEMLTVSYARPSGEEATPGSPLS